MKQLLLTTIAAVLVVGCGPPDISIHKAAEAGNIEAVKQHLAAGTDVNARDEDGWTPLDWSGVHEPEITKLLLRYGGKKADWFKAGNSIHAAAKAGHIEAVKKHLADGVDVNAEPEGGGWNALYCAAAYGHKEIVALLIAKGANINQKDEQGIRPLDRAVRNTDVVDLLRKNGAKSGAEDSIHIAAMIGNIGAIKRHLTASVNVNVKNDFDQTPLDLAIGGNQKETADLLRKHGGKTGEELKAEGK